MSPALQPRNLTNQEILSAFPHARRIVTAKERERRAERLAVVEEIKASLDLSRDRDEATREVWTEWVRLNYDPKLNAIDRHLWRLKSLKAQLRGKSPHSDRITPAMIERARAIPIESLADREIRKAGKLSRGLCPFHEERTPSFCIYSNNSFWCFGCGKGGDAIDFTRLRFGHSFQDAVRFLAARAAYHDEIRKDS